MRDRFFWVTSFLILLGMSLFSCGSSHDDAVRIQGELPIDSIKEVRVLNYMRGNELYVDTIHGREFDLRVDSLPTGMYQLVFAWHRHVVSPQEMKLRSRYDEQEIPKYYLTKNIWVGGKGKRQFHISMPDNQDQDEIENLLMERESFIAMDVKASDAESKVYEGLTHISQRYYDENLKKKDSLRHVMYALVTDGDMDGAKSINNKLNQRWLEEVEQAMKEEELAYLKQYNQHPMIPYVLYGRIVSKADFKVYQEVYEAIDPRIKEQVHHVFEGYME